MMKILLVTTVALALTGCKVYGATTTEDLIQKDGLGYSCVSDADLESYWALGGKLARAPQVCMADVCEPVPLSSFENQIVGRKVDPLVYDAFLRRQDGKCGGPVRAAWTDAKLYEALSHPPAPLPVTPSAVPLPSSVYMLMLALVGLVLTGIGPLRMRKAISAVTG